ncbi:hypothetical protein LIER_32090 [Lithospermum erythrorhizon]|uniref:Integrase catalytic domain-containing protein n=1 Tax=Lithospermum erythrorhizon TaxID=34254 RepID=A0AAV3RWV9_LITER
MSGKQEEVVDFIKSNIIYRFGVAKYIITDNGKAFDNKMIADLCNRFKIRKYHSTMYYPQANGLAEAFNNTLSNLIKCEEVQKGLAT